jgi:hypothetical protein
VPLDERLGAIAEVLVAVQDADAGDTRLGR